MRAAFACALALLAAPVSAQAPAQQWEPYSAALQSRAAAGDPTAQFILGEAFRTGNGIGPDREQAIAWYRKAAGSDPRAADALGILLFTKGERKQAIPLLQAAAARRNDYALYILGTARFNGDYVPKDIARAYADLRIAAATLPQAQRSLGLMEPYVTPIDRQRADQLAAQTGGPEAGGPVAPAYALAPPLVATPPMPKVRVTVPTTNVPAAVPARGIAAPSIPLSASSDAPASSPIAGPTLPPPTGGSADAPKVPVRALDPPTARSVLPSSAATVVPLAKPSVASLPPPVTLPARKAAPSPVAMGWRIQLGAYSSEERAAGQWKILAAKVPALAKLRKMTQPAGTGSLVRLQAAGIASRDDATAVCQSVTAAGGPCLVLAPAG